MKMQGERGFLLGGLTKGRHELCMLDVNSKQRSADEVSMNEFIEQFQKIVDKSNMTAEHI